LDIDAPLLDFGPPGGRAAIVVEDAAKFQCGRRRKRNGKETTLDSPNRRRAVVFVVPLILALVGIRRVSDSVRTVDLLQILAAGMLIGITLVGIIQMLKTRGASKP
jgi:hypothetical protein